MERAREHKYLVISPVKDEECHVERTLQSVVRQTVKPLRWVIVDDGSSDRTPEIVARYAAEHPFIQTLRRESGGARQPGSAVIRAFNAGYASIGGLDYDYVVKLDCDLSFEPDYFAELMSRFNEDERLGIASGVYLEPRSAGAWAEIGMPSYHAAGASKVVRRQCFEQIGGFVADRGWDTVDEIRAISRGWRTAHFKDLRMKHWKTEGSGIGPWRTSFMHGEVYYLTGGGGLFFLLKALHRVACRPYLVGAAGLVWGYLSALCKGKERLVNDAEARRYRHLLHGRITGKLKQVFAAPAHSA